MKVPQQEVVSHTELSEPLGLSTLHDGVPLSREALDIRRRKACQKPPPLYRIELSS